MKSSLASLGYALFLLVVVLLAGCSKEYASYSTGTGTTLRFCTSANCPILSSSGR
jgi:hypothetical protein